MLGMCSNQAAELMAAGRLFDKDAYKKLVMELVQTNRELREELGVIA